MVSAENVALTAADQAKINKFSRLLFLLKTTRESVEQVRDRVQQCKDSLEEVEICMESDGLKLLVGEALAVASEDEITDELNRRLVSVVDCIFNLLCVFRPNTNVSSTLCLKR